MKFLVDAQLPRRLAEHLRQAGPSAIHTLDLPEVLFQGSAPRHMAANLMFGKREPT